MIICPLCFGLVARQHIMVGEHGGAKTTQIMSQGAKKKKRKGGARFPQSPSKAHPHLMS
jgi:NAD/NADP transhydrogenase alpha subunit